VIFQFQKSVLITVLCVISVFLSVLLNDIMLVSVSILVSVNEYITGVYFPVTTVRVISDGVLLMVSTLCR